MAYPTNLDSFVTHANGDIIDPDYDNEQQVAISALEAKVGVDSSAVTTSHDYMLSEVTDKAVGKTATQTLTNKTLTSPVVNVGSDATGDMYYRNAGVLTRIPVGSDNQIMKLNGTTPNWEAETTVIAATESAEGISRIATAAQITAGTATEGGYPLFVAPDQLASSTPVFNGSGLTGVTDRLTSDTTNTTFNNSSAENTLFTYSVPANTLGTNGGILLKGIVDFAVSAANINCTFRVKYGGTTLASFGTSGVSGTPTFTAVFSFDVLLQGAGATGSQEANVMYTQTGTSFSAISGAALGSSSIDSTASQNLIVTAQMDTASASSTSAVRNYFIMKLV